MNSRMAKVASAEPREAAKLVYQWVKTGVITFREFETLYPRIDKVVDCDICGGLYVGVPGNTQFCGGTIRCDHCAAEG